MKKFLLFFCCIALMKISQGQQVNTGWANDEKIGIGTDAPETELSVVGELMLQRTKDDDLAPSSKLSFQHVTEGSEHKKWYIQTGFEASATGDLMFYEEEGRSRFRLNGGWGWVFYDENAEPEIFSEGAQGGGVYIPGSLYVGEMSVGSFNAYSLSSSYFTSPLFGYSGNSISLQTTELKYTSAGGGLAGTAHAFTVTTPLTQANASIATFSNGGTALVSIDKDGNYNSTGKITTEGDISTSAKMKVGTGTLDVGTHSLAVNGSAIFTKAHVKLNDNWPDYVFEPDYELPSLLYVELFIKEHKHLPGIPSAREVEDKGIDLGETQSALLKKIEELTLYIIEQDKRIKALEQKLNNL